VLTPDEGHAVAAILEAQRRAVETEELERRIVVTRAKQGDIAMRVIAQRVVKLERDAALAACSLDLRVFSTIAEAEADAEPAEPEVEVVRIVTGVRRSPNARTL
jgi:hypothetical protein